MKYLSLVNLGVVSLSACLFGYLDHLLDVSSQKSFAQVASGFALRVFFYWLAFGLAAIANHKSVSEKLFAAPSWTVISIVGAFCETLFRIARNVYGDWGYLSFHQNQFYSRHVEPQFTFFFEDFCAMLIIIGVTTTLVKLLLESRVFRRPE